MPVDERSRGHSQRPAPMAGLSQVNSGEFAEHWSALAGATAAVGTGAALFSYTANYFVLPIEAAQGWTRGQIAFGMTLNMLVIALTMPIVGMLTDRFGVRRIGTVGIAGYGSLCLALAMLPISLPLYYGMLVGIALFCAGTTGVVFGPFVAQRFRRHRGAALGIMMSGSAIFLVPLAPVLTAAMAEYGWRFGYAALGGAALLVGLPSALLSTRRSPVVAITVSQPQTGLSFSAALRSPAYWKILAAVCASTLALGGFLNQLSAILNARGVPSGQIAWLMSLFMLMVVIGRVCVGILLDALSPPLVAMGVMLAAAAGVSLLLLDSTPTPALALVVVLIGAAMGAEGDLQAFLMARHFGLRNFATLFGTSATCTSAFLGLGAFLFGSLYDYAGDYTLAVLIAIGLFIAAGLCFGSIGSTEGCPSTESESNGARPL